jgi:hypothetical protein
VPQVRQDLFPAFVGLWAADEETPLDQLSSAPLKPHATGYQLDKARVVLYNDSIVIAVDGDDGPRIVFREAIDVESYVKGTHKTDTRVRTVSGKMVVFKKNEACGCGSRLRSWNPYGIINSSKDVM